MKILVTGAVGFIGSHTCERLQDLGHEVIGLDNFSDFYSLKLKALNHKLLLDKGIEVIKADLRFDNLSKILPLDFDYVFHFAAHPGIASGSSFKDYFSNNVVATKRLVEFAHLCQSLKLLVNIGTSSVYGLNAIYCENSELKPISIYGITKLKAEQLVLDNSKGKVFKSCSLRLFSVIGPRERPEKLYTKLLSCAFSGQPFPLYEGSALHRRSFTFVNDIVDGVVSVIGKESRVDGEVINLGSTAEYSTQVGIDMVARVTGLPIKLNHVTARLGDQLKTKANIDKAKRLLNYNPTTSLLDSVKAQFEWYKSTFN